MNEARKQEMEALKDEYRMLLREAEEARECGNRAGESQALYKLHRNYMDALRIDINVQLEEMGIK